jgi:protein phosphatase
MAQRPPRRAGAKSRRRAPSGARGTAPSRAAPAPKRPAPSRRRPLALAAAVCTDIGRRRSHNEDASCCDAAGGLFIVADGMGGKAAGEAASRAVVTVLPPLLRQTMQALHRPSPARVKETLSRTLNRLSLDLYRQSRDHPALAGLGSTVVVLFARDGVGYVGQAGDSRVYLLRGGTLERMTEDQTTAMALVRLGNLAPADAERHPLSHSLEEYIGKETDLNPRTRWRRLRPGDRWLLCSDGLTRGLTDEALCRILRSHADPEAACRALIDAANAADGSDNITALVADVTG